MPRDARRETQGREQQPKRAWRFTVLRPRRCPFCFSLPICFFTTPNRSSSNVEVVPQDDARLDVAEPQQNQGFSTVCHGLVQPSNVGSEEDTLATINVGGDSIGICFTFCQCVALSPKEEQGLHRLCPLFCRSFVRSPRRLTVP